MSAIQNLYKSIETSFKDDSDFQCVRQLTTNVHAIRIKFSFSDYAAKEKTTKFKHSYSLIPQNDPESKLKFFAEHFSKTTNESDRAEFDPCLNELKALLTYSPQNDTVKATQKKAEQHLLAASKSATLDEFIHKIDLLVKNAVPKLGNDKAWSKSFENLIGSVVLIKKESLPTIFHEEIFQTVRDGLVQFIEQDWKDKQENIILNTLLQTYETMDVKDREIRTVRISVDYTDSEKKDYVCIFDFKKKSSKSKTK